MPALIRPMRPTDHAAAHALWSATPGVGTDASDEPAAIAAYLERNPGMSFVADDGAALVGAVLGGSDGRRGYLHHLAVAPSHRGQGLGRELVEHALAALAAAGMWRCHVFVYASNPDGQAFWARGGWRVRTDLVMMSREIG